MLEGGIDLVLKFLAVDGGPAAAGTCRIARLEHKVWNYAMEYDIIIVSTAGEFCKVFAGLERNR